MEPRKIIPVIDCCGDGTGLWPISRSLEPKPFQADLCGGRALLRDTLQRVADPARFEPPRILCEGDLHFLAERQLRESGMEAAEIVSGLAAGGALAGVCASVLSIAETDPNAILLVLPASTVVKRPGRFYEAVDQAAAAARQGWRVIFATLDGLEEEGGARIVPAAELETAHGQAGHAWNRGALMSSAGHLIRYVEARRPALVEGCRQALASAPQGSSVVRLDNDAEWLCPATSLDELVMETTEDLAVVATDTGWRDLSTWGDLWDVSEKDVDGNTALGDVFAAETSNSFLHGGDRLLAAIGVDSLAVVATEDAVLVCPKERSGEVGALVECLKAKARDVTDLRSMVRRPWGSYTCVHRGAGFQVKELTVDPGCVLSLQRHRHRAEHWVVVAGEAEVTCDDSVFRLQPQGSTFVPLGAIHRLANRGNDVLRVIEVQFGSYLGEDDIERFDDVYGRVTTV